MECAMELSVAGDAPILMVDDSAVDREIATICHRMSGIPNPLVAFGTPSALLAHLATLGEAAEAAPGMLLIDVRMPEMDGFELIREVRDLTASGAGPAIVMLSSSDDPRDRAEALSMGCAAYLVKPDTITAYVGLFRSFRPDPPSEAH